MEYLLQLFSYLGIPTTIISYASYLIFFHRHIAYFINRPKDVTMDVVPWGRFDHSRSLPGLVPITLGETIAVRNIVTDAYKNHATQKFKIQRINTESASVNYKITPSDTSMNPFLLRLHKRVKSETALKTLHNIHNEIINANIFSDSDQYPIGIRPIMTDEGQTFKIYNSEGVWKNKLFYHPQMKYLSSESQNSVSRVNGISVSAYPFVEHVRYIGKCGVSAINDLGYKYGMVQATLKKLEPYIDLRPLAGLHPEITYLSEVNGEFPYFNAVRDGYNNKNNREKEWAKFYAKYGSDYEILWETLKHSISRLVKTKKVLLHDFHPHNAFFHSRKDECVLIYDYESVRQSWTEEMAISFTFHRFFRELVVAQGKESVKDAIIHFINFMSHYQRSNPSIDIDNLLENMYANIVLVNFGKLIQNIGYWGNLLYDNPGRSEKYVRQEVYKFASYLIEAKNLSDALEVGNRRR